MKAGAFRIIHHDSIERKKLISKKLISLDRNESIEAYAEIDSGIEFANANSINRQDSNSNEFESFDSIERKNRIRRIRFSRSNNHEFEEFVIDQNKFALQIFLISKGIATAKPLQSLCGAYPARIPEEFFRIHRNRDFPISIRGDHDCFAIVIHDSMKSNHCD